MFGKDGRPSENQPECAAMAVHIICHELTAICAELISQHWKLRVMVSISHLDHNRCKRTADAQSIFHKHGHAQAGRILCSSQISLHALTCRSACLCSCHVDRQGCRRLDGASRGGFLYYMQRLMDSAGLLWQYINARACSDAVVMGVNGEAGMRHRDGSGQSSQSVHSVPARALHGLSGCSG